MAELTVDPSETLPVGLAEKKDIDVAACVFSPQRIRAKYEGKGDAFDRAQGGSEPSGKADRAFRQLLKRPQKRIASVNGPQPDVADAATLQNALPAQLFQGNVDGPWRAPCPTHNLTRMELAFARVTQ